jgi:copper chaperone
MAQETATTLRIENMHCGACIRRVTQTLRGIPGTRVEEVQIGGAQVESTAEPGVIVAALAKAGYPARLE